MNFLTNLFESRSFNETTTYSNYYEDGVGPCDLTIVTQKTYPWYQLQIITNVAITAFLTYKIFPKTIFNARPIVGEQISILSQRYIQLV